MAELARLTDSELAEEHYDAAVTLERRAGVRLFCSHSQRRWASLFWKRGTARDRDRARDLIVESAAAYRTLGLPGLADQAEDITQL